MDSKGRFNPVLDDGSWGDGDMKEVFSIDRRNSFLLSSPFPPCVPFDAFLSRHWRR